MKSYTTYREKDFIGYNDTVAPEFLPKGYVADALNCFIDTGQIVKRKGYTIIGNDLGSAACQALKGVRFADATKRIYAVFNGTVYYRTSGNWTSLGGTLVTSGYVDIVVANNAVYFFDGTNTVVKVDSSNTLSTVAAIPIGKYAKWFHNQLHVAGVAAAPNTLYSSNIGAPEDHSGGNFSAIAVNPNDGDYITGLGELNNELMVFKVNRVWSVSGFGTAALTVDDLNERLTGFGTLSHRSIVNTGNDLMYLGFLGNLPVIRSLRRTREGTIVDAGNMTDDIEGTMSGLNKGALDKPAGAFDGTRAWFAVPNGASAFNNLVLVYDQNTKGWTRQTGIQASCFDLFTNSATPQMYFGEASADSKAYVFDTSTSDNGTAINFQVITRRYGGDEPEIKKKFKHLYVSAEEVGNYDITVDKAGDGFTYDNLGTLNLAGSGTQFDNIILDTSRLGTTDVKKKRFDIAKSRNYYMQFKMYDTSATSSVNIRNWELLRIDKKVPIST